MPSQMDSDDPRPTGVERQEQVPLGLDDFSDPDDQGLSLEQLSQAYAALLNHGPDPYPDRPPSEDDAEAPSPAESDEWAVAPVIRGEDQAACEITPKSILEAVLFVGHPTGEPLMSERIAGLMRGVRPAEIDDLVRELNAEYQAEGAPYAIVSVGAGYQMALRPEFAPLRDAFYGRIREARLSAASLDVLAVVAYHQPIDQDGIDRLRDKSSGAILSQLVRRDLIAIDRPADKRLKPTYRTTARFLELFGLSDLSQLPRSQEVEREL